MRPGQNLRPGLRGLSPSVTVTPAKSRALGPVTITPRLAPASFPGMKNPAEKDKAKPDGKTDSILNQEEKVEKDCESNSNVHGDSPGSSSATNEPATKSEEKSDEAEKAKELLRISKQDSFNHTLSKVAPETKFDLQKDTSGTFHSQSGQDHSRNNMSDIPTSLKSFHHTSSSHSQDIHSVSGQENRDGNQSSAYVGNSMYLSSEKNSQSSTLAYPGNFSSNSSLNKPYGSNIHSGSLLSSVYKASADLSSKDSKPASVENHWKSPPAPISFSSGASGSKSSSQQRNQENSTYNEKSSIHSNLSSKTTAMRGSSIESRSQSSSESSLSPYAGTDLSTSHGKSSSKHSSAHTTSSNHNSPPKPASSSSSSSIATPSSTNFSSLDPYTNLYGSYGAYPSSNYYNPFSYPTGFLPDPKSSLSSKTSTETNPTAAVPPSRSSSNPSAPRSDSKKTSQEPSRSSLSSAYDRQGSSSSSTNAHSNRSSNSSTSSSSKPGGSSSTVPEAAGYSSSSSAAAAASAYNPMMMSPSFNPASCQYPPPSTASGSTNPFTAAAANYASPYGSPYGYPGPNQFESEIARASMYSAFHRPEGGLDPTSPYLPLPAHSRPVTGTPASAGSFYSQNVYGTQYGSTRDPYSQLPYPASPLFMPPGPYGGLASSTPSAATSDQSSSQS